MAINSIFAYPKQFHMHLFYCQNIESDRFLNEEESHHCVKVLRAQIGDKIQVMDGKGSIFICTIEIANHRRVAVKIKKNPNPRINFPSNISPLYQFIVFCIISIFINFLNRKGCLCLDSQFRDLFILIILHYSHRQYSIQFPS